MRHELSWLGQTPRAFAIALVIGIVAASVAPFPAIAQSLDPTGYWEFTGAGTVTNQSLVSTGSNTSSVLTLGGAAPVYAPQGIVGSAVEMSYPIAPVNQAAAKWLDLNVAFGAGAAPTGGYALGNSFTIGGWYYVTDISSGLRTTIWDGATSYDIALANDASGSTNAIAYNSTAAAGEVPVSGALTTGTWHHVIQSYSSDGTTTAMTVYLDGASVGTTSGVASSTISDSGIHLATSRTTNVRPLYGLMDEIAVWNSALSAADALDAYNRGLAGVTLTDASVVTGYGAAATDNAWLTGGNWAGGVAPGQTGDSASTDSDIAVVGNYAFTGGLGIDMASASGNLALGAVTFNSLAGSGDLLLGNSSASSGTLTLNGAVIDGFANVILNSEGGSNLTLANVQGSDSGQQLTLQLGGTANMVRAAEGRTLTIATDIVERAANSNLTIDGGGVVAVSGTNNYTGTTIVSAGTLAVAATTALPGWDTAGRFSVASGAAIEVGSGIADANVATLSATGNFAAGSSLRFDTTAGDRTLSAGLAGAAEVVKAGGGTLTLSGTNTYSGGTVVGAGTVTVASANALGSGPLDVDAGGTVAFDTPGVSTHAIPSISGAGTLLAAGKTLTIGADNSDSTFAGTITAATLTKQGSGRLSLSGSNTLTDARIEAGSLFANSGTALGSGTVTLAGGRLQVAAGTSLSNAIVLDAAAASNVLGSAVELEYLVVGGGGSGVDGYGGAGGAGGFLTGSMMVSDPTSAVVVGAGGARADVTAAGSGNPGQNSSFAAIVAAGGGAGGTYSTGGTPTSGGSGGGAGSINGQAGGAGTLGQGNAGGAGYRVGSVLTGGGGGGAGEAGSAGTASAGGKGGDGLSSDITGATVWYAGGGGGSGYGGTFGAGGLGGGGRGGSGSTYNGTDGLANTGGGGGGAQSDNSAFNRGVGGAGGSGIVVVRYAGAPVATGGTIDTSSVPGYTIHTFTNVGSENFVLNPSTTIASTIGGTGGFTLDTPGTLTLSGTNTFAGGTIVSAGTLVAANASALGSGTATVASGARLQLDSGSIIANAIADLGTGSFLGTLDFAGGGLARTSTAGGTTQGTLLAGSAGAAASLNPNISWLAQTSATASDIMQLTNTSGTAQVLSLTYDPLLTPASPQEAYLGWFDTATTDWVNAIDGNVGGTASFFAGSWNDYLTLNPGTTPSSALGVYGHDSATNSVWAVVNHNSDFAAIVVPEPASLALTGLGLAGLIALLRRRRATPAV